MCIRDRSGCAGASIVCRRCCACRSVRCAAYASVPGAARGLAIWLFGDPISIASTGSTPTLAAGARRIPTSSCGCCMPACAARMAPLRPASSISGMPNSIVRRCPRMNASSPKSSPATGSARNAACLHCGLANDDARMAELRRELTTAAGGLPVLLLLFGIAGMLWADVALIERWRGLDSFLKLLVIPLLFIQFRRSERAVWVFSGYVIACVALLLASYVLVLWPELSFHFSSDFGVPVKNAPTQSLSL